MKRRTKKSHKDFLISLGQSFGLLCLSVFLYFSLAYFQDSKGERNFKSSFLPFFKNLSQSKNKNTSGIERKTEMSSISPSYISLKKEVSVIHLVDPSFKKQWGLHHIRIEKAWEKHKEWGTKNVIVAIIDTGIDVNHPDIRNNLWMNKGEVGTDEKGRDKSKNGKDDDQNGFVDDVHGWNFALNNSDLTDKHGHGTHVAGIIGAEGGNGIGVSGVAHKVSFMVLKYFDPETKSDHLKNTIRSIQYATRMKAHIINYSGGGLLPSQEEKKAIAEARKQGILFVAAAGNERSNIDKADYFPSDYDLDNILSVTAINQKSFVLESSNYGSSSVDIAAPGSRIFSTLPRGGYGYMTGTSQATAFVTGVAVLILSKFPDLSAYKLIRHLTETGDLDVQRLGGKTRFRKRLNTYRAIAMLDQGMSASGAFANGVQPQFSSEFDPASQSKESFLSHRVFNPELILLHEKLKMEDF